MTLKERVIHGLIVGVIAAVVVIGGLYIVQQTSDSEASLGVVGSQLIEQYVPYVLYNGGINSALPIETSSTITGGTITGTALVGTTLQVGSTGSTLTKIITGFMNCTGSATIGTTTSATYDCSVTGAASGDKVFVTASSSNPSTVLIANSYASTTVSNSVRVVMFNASSSPSGTIATTSIPFLITR